MGVGSRLVIFLSEIRDVFPSHYHKGRSQIHTQNSCFADH